MTDVAAEPRYAIGPFVPPRLGARVRSTATDDGGRRLALFATGLIRRAPTVVRGVVSASQDAVCLADYVDDPAVEDRAWVCRDGAVEVFCVLDADGERRLLSLIVGSAPAGRLSALERRIVGDAVLRLLSGPGDPQDTVREELRRRPAGRTWCCSIELCGRERSPATIRLFEPRVLPQQPPGLRPTVRRIPVTLRALAPVAPTPLAAVNSWRPGVALRIAPTPHMLGAVLYVAGRRIARAQAGAVAGERAVRITDMQMPGPSATAP